MKDPRALLCVLALFVLASRSAAEVRVVDAGGAFDHTDIQAAIDAAVDGDTILLRRPPVLSRRFRGFEVDGKSLVIQGDMIERARVGPIVVRNLGPGQEVKLAHLLVNPLRYPLPPEVYAPGLELEANEGTVWVHACEVLGSEPPGDPGILAMRVGASARVLVTASRIEGGGGADSMDSGHGITARQSSLWVYDSEIAGAEGGFGLYGYGPGGRGGDGVRLRASQLYVAGSVIRGGNGGATFGDESPGGDGLVVPDDSTAVSFDSELLGGEPAIFSDGGTPGEPFVGLVNQLPGSAPGFVSPQHAEQGATVTLRFTGTPGDAVVLLVSSRVTARPLGSTGGYLHVGRPFRRVLVGNLPGSGELEHPFVVPDAPPGGARNLVLQAVFVGSGTSSVSSGPELMSSLDPQFVPRCGRRIHVDADAAPGGDGSSWANAYSDLRLALGAVPECPEEATELWVAEGTYRPAAPGGDRERNFYVYSDTHLYGGFEGNETRLDERDPGVHPVILSGDLNGDDTPGFGNRADNAAHVLQSGVHQFDTRNVRLEGLVVRGGNALAQGNDQVAFRGGGLYVRGNIEIFHCTFTDNHADVMGGGIYWLGNSMSVSHCRFIGNHAGRGGGMTAESGGPLRIVSSLFAGNLSDNGTAGLSMRAYAPGSSREVRNCVVYANIGGYKTAGIVDIDTQDGPLVIANTIVWDNVSLTGTGQETQLRFHTDDARIDYSCVQDLTALPGVGTIADNPLFVDPIGPDGLPGTEDDDLRLDAGSPCIDAGSNVDAPADLADVDGDGDRDEPAPFDLDGAARFQDDPNAPDTGSGTPPLIDMGPFERTP